MNPAFEKMNSESRRGSSENKNDFSFLRIFGIFIHLMAFSYPIEDDGGCFEIVETINRSHSDTAKVKAVGMESLYPDLMRILLQYLDVRSMMMLRCVSTTLRERVDEWEIMFQNWKFTTAFSTTKLYKFADI
ncbi:uncharacterized protein LOC111716956 [Eurytemora carolleeae]|uniref:uncharacterized protein LOC111716956 n=1 Tax=Eurytemora carolleeae TaxID=1294199 RepID=UPI000C76ED04|nr:uncharacterized protein LOC111716956 [Eurytemora carolleeae]|eukprot:XP_023348237.1 uncharacterized protein LOC111716956 [Eurytemora affinis]